MARVLPPVCTCHGRKKQGGWGGGGGGGGALAPHSKWIVPAHI